MGISEAAPWNTVDISSTQSTKITAVRSRVIEADGGCTSCVCDVLDTTGQVQKTSAEARPRAELKLAQAFVVIYSITSRETFEDADRFLEEIKKSQKRGAQVPVCLIGNKMDQLPREVTRDEGEWKAEEWRR